MIDRMKTSLDQPCGIQWTLYRKLEDLEFTNNIALKLLSEAEGLHEQHCQEYMIGDQHEEKKEHVGQHYSCRKQPSTGHMKSQFSTGLKTNQSSTWTALSVRQEERMQI